MAFTTKDFYSYPNTTSKSASMVLLVAIPDGGGGFTLRNLTKGELFQLQSQPIDFITGAGANDLITINGTDNKLRFIPPGVWLLQGDAFGLSANGTSSVVQLNLNGSIQLGDASTSLAGKILLVDSNGFTTQISREVQSNGLAQMAFLEDQKMEIAVGIENGTIFLDNVYNLTQVIDQRTSPLVNLTIQFPDEPKDSQIANITVYGNIASPDFASSTGTILFPPTSATGDFTTWKFQYNESSLTWFRLA